MRTLRFAIPLLLCVSLSAAAFGQSPAVKARQAMVAMNDAYAKALMAKDIGFFEKTATPDFYEVSQDGKTKMTRAQAIAGVKGLFSMATKITRVDTKLVSMSFSGNTAVAVNEGTVYALIPRKGGGSAKLVDWTRTKETWTNATGIWMVKSVIIVSDKTTIDGKPAR